MHGGETPSNPCCGSASLRLPRSVSSDNRNAFLFRSVKSPSPKADNKGEEYVFWAHGASLKAVEVVRGSPKREDAMDMELDHPGQQPSREAIERLVLHEQVALIYRLTPAALLISAAPALVIWWTVHLVYPGPRSDAWLIGSLVLPALRLVLNFLYRRSKAGPETAGFWSRLYFVCTLAYGLQWGYAGTVLFPVDHQNLQAMITAILIGTAAGAFPFVLALRRAYAIFLVPAVLPFALYMIYLGAPEQVFIGCLSILFIGIMLLSTAGVSKNIVENIASRFKQALLGEEIRCAQRRTEEANRLLRVEIEEKKQAEEALRESEIKYRRIFESLEDLYYQTDTDGIIRVLSPSVYRLAGWKPEEAHRAAGYGRLRRELGPGRPPPYSVQVRPRQGP